MGVTSKIFLVSIVLLLSCSSVAEPPEILYKIEHPSCKKYFSTKIKRDYEKDPFIKGDMPKFDFEELKNSIVYPEYAKENNIEGRVVVRVLIDTLGRALKVFIDSTANDYLNKSALTAVFNTEFESATEINGNKATVWISIPLIYKLNN